MNDVPTDTLPIITFGDLLPGDVLLYRPLRPNENEKRISQVTDSPYTHAAIYLGASKIAEATTPDGVMINPLDTSLEGSMYAAVMRSQCGWGRERIAKLNEFAQNVAGAGVPFHRRGLVRFSEASQEFFDNQMAIIGANYGELKTVEQLAAGSYFCSGFVTACYEAVGIIDETAQVAYPSEVYSPKHLYEDPTFGWLLGYLVPSGASVPSDDPTLAVTRWVDIDALPDCE
ncbi:hypothetical protein HFO06_28690 [Rhizobium leguminosarum]|uniref:hypothetical protein n=1 Tax=Rhizobium leguminosarum TaxID=384 RepID=UPI001C978169|nr:hypothetical protein [Rhizobium leguminosarum]MBY5767029.1 hypothetical protein [Rhizobium leguminosarum]